MLRTRLGLGFALMILITVGQGVANYLMSQRIAKQVSELDSYRLPATERATTIERQAWETIVAEKDYFESRSDEFADVARSTLKTLTTELETIGQLATQHSDTTLADATANTGKRVAEYGRLFEQGAAAVRKTEADEETLDQKGNAVNEAVEQLVARQKTQYIEAKDSLAIANSINALSLEARMHEKAYMLDRDKTHLAAIERNVASITDSCDELGKRHPNETEKKQIASARKEIAEYLKAA